MRASVADSSLSELVNVSWSWEKATANRLGSALAKHSHVYSVSTIAARHTHVSGPFEIHSRYCKDKFEALIDIIYKSRSGKLVKERFTKKALETSRELGEALKLAGDEPRRMEIGEHESIR